MEVINLYPAMLVFKFYCMVYKKFLLEQKREKLWNKQYCVENKTGIKQRVLKMQYVSLLPKYMKWI